MTTCLFLKKSSENLQIIYFRLLVVDTHTKEIGNMLIKYICRLLASERSERDTIRDVQIRDDAVRIYIICISYYIDTEKYHESVTMY